MTKKIAHKLRIQGTQHRGNFASLKANTNVKTKKTLKLASVHIRKLIPPDHTKLFNKINKDIKLRPWQVLEVSLFSVEVKVTKGNKLSYLYFDKVTKVPVIKKIFGGRRKGALPHDVEINLQLPTIPGTYNLLQVLINVDCKKKKVVVSNTSETTWQQIQVA